METNNGIEAQNKVLKHSYLPRNRNISLSQLANILINDFLPDAYRKYLFQNCKMNPSYRSYSDKVPEYLHGRPPALIKHCLSRLQKAKKKFKAESFTACDDMNGKFTIASESATYQIDFGVTSGQPSCSCGDWAKTHFPCKHFCAVFLYVPNWGWNLLPSSYLSSAYLCADSDVLTQSSLLGVSDNQDVSLEDVDVTAVPVYQGCSGEELDLEITGDREVSALDDQADMPDDTADNKYVCTGKEDQGHHTCSDLKKRVC